MENQAFDPEDVSKTPQTDGATETENGHVMDGTVSDSTTEKSKQPASAPYAGMGKEDLLRFSQTPFWKRLRLASLVIFWMAWLGLLTAVITLTIILPRCKPAPEQSWWQRTNFYQVYLRSFHDNDADGVGDFKGLQSKLDYLESTSTGALILSSFYRGQAGQKDFGYEITDHTDVDPAYGTMDDFERLLEDAHNRGIKVIIDFVPNYTGRDHDWFKESSADFNQTNPYWNYYVWTPCREDELPNNWRTVYGEEAWTFVASRGECYLHQFTAAQPELDLRNSSVQQELEGILRFWLNKGVDGFRVNEPAFLFESTDLNNEVVDSTCNNTNAYECQSHDQTRNLPEVYDMIHRWRQILDEYSDDGYKVLLTDAHEDINITSNYYGMYGARGAQLPINYQLSEMSNDCGGNCVRDLVGDWLDLVPEGETSTWAMSSQDLSRVERKVSDPGRSFLSLMLAFTLPGVPVVYYGQEIAMVNAQMDGRTSIDPAGNLDSALFRDQYRSPMQWANETYAGFMNTTLWEEQGKTTEPWLPVNQDYGTINVQVQEESSKSRLSMYKALSALRRLEPAIYVGDYYTALTNNNTFSYVREFNGADSFLIAMNFGTTSTTEDFASSLTKIPSKANVYFSTSKDLTTGQTINLNSATLSPGTGAIFVWEYTR